MIEETQNNSSSVAKVNYILFIISTIIGLTAVIAIVIAYVNKDDAPEWLKTHYRFQIRTFWIGLLYITIGFITLHVLIGGIILLFSFFWLVIRCAKGLKQLYNEQPVANLESWFLT